MARFIKTDEPHIVSPNVIVFVRKKDDGVVVGRIITMKVTHAGVTPTTTASDDPPVADALRLASDLADAGHVDVSVVDPDGLLQSDWGLLD